MLGDVFESFQSQNWKLHALGVEGGGGGRRGVVATLATVDAFQGKAVNTQRKRRSALFGSRLKVMKFSVASDISHVHEQTQKRDGDADKNDAIETFIFQTI